MSLRIRAFGGLLAFLVVSCSGPVADPQSDQGGGERNQSQSVSLEVAVGQLAQITLTN